MSIAQYEKALSGLTRAIRQLGSKKETTDRERRDILKKAQNAAQLVLIDDLISEIQTELNDVEQKIEESLKQRREQLLIAARDSGTPHKRFTDYDRVGIFKVTYKGQKIQLDIGSEILMTIEETNGDKAFDAINKAAQELESTPFSRDEFFATIKSAFGYARADGNIREGSIAVKALYVYVVSARHLRSSNYLKNPSVKAFQDYSLAQFAYDLARFGRDGWFFGKEALKTMTPNMVTIKAGKALMLPSLDSVEKQGPQFATLKIEKREF